MVDSVLIDLVLLGVKTNGKKEEAEALWLLCVVALVK